VITAWNGYFTAQAGAFAALTGLVFVALSINLKHILTLPGVSGRAGEAIIVLVEPVLVALLGLTPDQSVHALGVEVLVVSVAAWTFASGIVVRGFPALRSRPWHEAARRVLLVEVATLLVVVAGCLLAAGDAAGLYWQVAGTGTCLVVGMFDAWVLLIEILR